MTVKQQNGKEQIMTTQQITENKKPIDFATLYKTALKVMDIRKQVIDGLKDK